VLHYGNCITFVSDIKKSENEMVFNQLRRRKGTTSGDYSPTKDFFPVCRGVPGPPYS